MAKSSHHPASPGITQHHPASPSITQHHRSGSPHHVRCRESTKTSTQKAQAVIGICFERVERVTVRELPDPVIEMPTDALVRVELAGLCGSDLHPYFGREQGILPGTVMGHEFVGEVIGVGSDVRRIKIGDRVCAPFTTNCGHCHFCKIGLTSRCVSGELFGWRQKSRGSSTIEGLHGGQATMVRVPLADGTLMQIPDGISSRVALLLGDNLSTGRFAAEMADVQPSGVYAVVGCGTVGLLAIVAAQQLVAAQKSSTGKLNTLKIIAVDPCESRLKVARSLGAECYADGQQALTAVMEQTESRGADGVMEMVGLPAAQELAFAMLRPGGTLSVIGCHCSPHFTFSPANAYDKNLVYRTGRCPARHYMALLAKQMTQGHPDLSWCITHEFSLEDAEQAYEVFAGRKDQCIKAVIRM